MYRIGDRVILKRKYKNKCAGEVGTVESVNKSAVLVQFGVFQNPVWCRYSEVRKYTPLDEYFDSLCGGD